MFTSEATKPELALAQEAPASRLGQAEAIVHTGPFATVVDLQLAMSAGIDGSTAVADVAGAA